MTDFIYDIETYPNVFTITIEHADAPIVWQYEISDWRNDSYEIIEFLTYLKKGGHRLVGFNTIGFDYPVIHTLIRMGRCDAQTLYNKAQAIIASQNVEEGDDSDARWLHEVKPNDRFVQQIDLFRVHHFDNKAKRTSLKALEFNMRSHSIEDLPFAVGSTLNYDQTQELRRYNKHDVSETKKFWHHSKEMIAFREELMRSYPGRDWLNFNDGKIGKEYFIMKLEEAGISCYSYGPEGRRPRQTPRKQIALREAILPWIQFEQTEFQRVLNWYKEQTITQTKGAIEDIVATVNGFDFVFGLGGIHGSVEKRLIEATDDMAIVDIDVEAYYPSTAIAQRFRPAHYPEIFCDIYASLKQMRKKYGKGTPMNKMLKLALNCVFGDSGSRFSVFHDPLMMMAITLNGQLLLCLLAEWLMKIPGLQLIQCNTDGLTAYVPRAYMSHFDQAVAHWEGVVNLKMEKVEYRKMAIRDVNSYIAEDTSGKRKFKGAYLHPVEWHQDASAMIVPKVAEKALMDGLPIRDTVMNWSDPLDFMLRVKVPRTSKLFYETKDRSGSQFQIQNTSRYYIAKNGVRLYKLMPPLKGKTDHRRIAVESGWEVQVCNNLDDAGQLPIDYDYYVREIEKLVHPIQ